MTPASCAGPAPSRAFPRGGFLVPGIAGIALATLIAVCAAMVAAATGVALAADLTTGPVTPGVSAGDTRTLPTVEPEPWPSGMPVMEAPPRRVTYPEAALVVPVPRHERDPLLDLQPQGAARFPRVYNPPELNFDAQAFAPLQPPDTEGEIGSNYYIQTVNGANGTTVVIYDKTTGAIVSGPFLMSSLWTAGGACATGAGDAIVLYDQLASRWILSEFTSGPANTLCLYVSRNTDPIGGGWLNYAFGAPEFPDYPKYAVWPDAYYVTTNEPGGPPVYALDRAKMLAGLPATMQRFSAPSLAGFGSQALTPADLDGSPPPPGSPAFFVRHVDDEVHGAAVGGSDQIEVWQLAVDFVTPANSVFSLATSIPVAEFDSEFCGGDDRCIPQPGSNGLDPINELVMWRAQYRNFGAFQTLVGNLTTDVSGADQAGIRWFELHRVGLGAWSLFQEGTYAPDTDSRWMGSIAMDGSGNMALGFSISSATTFPGMRYTGRLLGSPPGVMDQTEVNVVSGVSSQAGERWGDYASMNVDPVDDCTFWFTSEYMGAGGLWQTRITRFRYDAPTCVNAGTPICGDNVKEVGEDCDGVDATYCPGLCTGACTCPAPACGNNALEVGEACDGTSLGACSACRPDCTCELCGATPELPGNCFLQIQPEAAKVSITDRIDNAKDRLKWIWNKGDATAIGDVGNPVDSGTRYELCVYDGSGNSQPLRTAVVTGRGTCAGKPCWRAIGKTVTGYKYNNKLGTPDGVTQLQVKTGSAGKSQLRVQGKGANLLPPNPILTLPVTVQLLVDNGGGVKCWQTTFTTATKNTDEQFKAKGP